MDKFRQTQEFFEGYSDRYADQITQIQKEFYQNTSRIIGENTADGAVMLDIGNGGVINYDVTKLSQLDCADIVLNPQIAKRYSAQKHIRFIKANVLKMPEMPDNHYDTVVIQCVIHHLADKNLHGTVANTKQALRECYRTLKPGGRLVIIESVVTGWFEKVEQAVYPFMQLFFKLCKFGAVYQYSAKSLLQLVKKEGYQVLRHGNVPVGKYIWIMTKKIPTKLTPCGCTAIIVEKRKDTQTSQ